MSRTIRQRLAKKLTVALGFQINDHDLHAAQGHWRTSRFADVFRWESPRHSIASWSTMTDCVRHGFEVTKGMTNSGTRYQIDAKG